MTDGTPSDNLVRSVADIDSVAVGHVTDPRALTGCTAVVFTRGAVAAHVVCGVASGSRELPVFTPRHAVERVHGVCFSGGSAFGLAAASGVMRRLAAEGIGHQTGKATVPIVAGAVVYDLGLGDADVRPDEEMGQQAAELALTGARAPRSGNVGAGAGVTAGKLLGSGCATKTGLGNAGTVSEDGLRVGALVVLNPVGDVIDPTSGRILAGTRREPSSSRLVGSANLIRAGTRCEALGQNTTLCLVATNAELDGVECEWIAEQASVALARCIDPPFTRHDGDLVICATVGGAPRRDLHRVGVLARDATQAAILDACRCAEPAGGLPSGHELVQPRLKPLSSATGPAL